MGRIENIVGKGENAGYRHFLLFPQCFHKASSSGSLKVGIVGERVKDLSAIFIKVKIVSKGRYKSGLCGKELTLSQMTNFRLPNSKSLQTTVLNFDENGRMFFKWVENTVGKGEIARYDQFILFP